MNYEELLEFSVELALRLQKCGAETYRVEETITRLFDAYGLEADTYVIPNSIFVCFRAPDGQNHTKIRRVKDCETILDGIERYSALCRKICSEKPSMEDAWLMLKETTDSIKHYNKFVYYLSHFLIGFGFAIFFQGTLLDAFCSGICGLATGLCLRFLNRLHANAFFKTVVGGFILAFISHSFAHIGLCDNADVSSIGAIMILVPGFLFTNSLRDVIYGDTMSGVNRLVQVLIIAAALVVGTGAAVSLTGFLWGKIDGSANLVEYSLFVQCIAAIIGTLGFSLLFDMHGSGMPHCLFGAALSWLVYSACSHIGLGDSSAFFVAAAAASFYAEVLARIRKYPATSYLIASLVPLIPGASLYYTMSYAASGDVSQFWAKGTSTAAIAGSMAVGVLLVSTVFRMWGVFKKNKFKKRAAAYEMSMIDNNKEVDTTKE